MQKGLVGLPVENFTVPPGVTFATINTRTGHLAREGSENSSLEGFVSGTEPTSYGTD